MRLTLLLAIGFLTSLPVVGEEKKPSVLDEMRARKTALFDMYGSQSPLDWKSAELKLHKKTYIEGAKSRMKDPVRDTFDLAVSIELDRQPGTLQEKNKKRQELLISFDKTRAARLDTSDPHEPSEALQDAADIVKEMDVPGDNLAAEAINKTKDTLAEAAKVTDKWLTKAVNGVVGEDTRAGLRSEADFGFGNYLDQIDGLGGTEAILEKAYDQAYGLPGGESLINFSSRQNFNNISPLSTTRQNLGQATAEFKGALASQFEHAMLEAKVDETGAKIVDKIEQTAKQHSEQLRKMEAKIDVVGADVKQIKKDIVAFKREFRREIKSLRTDLTNHIDKSATAVIDTLTKEMTKQNQVLHAEVLAVAKEVGDIKNFVVEQAKEEAELRRKQAEISAIEERFRLQTRLVDSVGGFVSLFATKPSQREAIKTLQVCLTTQLQVKRAFELVSNAMKPGNGGLTSSIMAAFTGDFFGAVVGLAGAFGPSSDQLMMEQLRLVREEIRAARDEIEKMRVQMHGRFDALEDKLDYYFAQSFGRFEDVIDSIADVKKEVELVHRELRDLRTSQAEIHANLTNVKEEVLQGIVAALKRDELKDFNYYRGLLSDKRMTMAQFDRAYSDTYSSSEISSRDDLSLGECPRNFEEAFSWASFTEHCLWQMSQSLPLEFAVERKFKFPRSDYWMPWTSLFAHLIVDTASLVKQERNPSLEAGIQEKLDLVEKTVESQRQILIVLRTPGKNAEGRISFPAFERLIELRDADFVSLQGGLRGMDLPEDKENVVKVSSDPKIQIYGATDRLALDPTPLSPKALFEFAALLNENVHVSQKFHNQIRWELRFGWDSKNSELKTFTSAETIPYEIWWNRGPTTIATWKKLTWEAKLNNEELWFHPKVELAGYLDLPPENNPEGNVKSTRVVRRTFVSKTAYLAGKYFQITNKPPRNMKYRRRDPKAKGLHPYDELMERKPDPIFDRPIPERAAEEILGSNSGVFHSLWAEAIRAKPEEWLDENNHRALLAQIAVMGSGARAKKNAVTLAVVRRAAMKGPSMDFPFDESLLSVERTVKRIGGIERVMMSLLHFALPEARRADLDVRLADPNGIRRLVALESLGELQNINSPGEEFRKGLETLAGEFELSPEQIRNLPELNTVSDLVSQAKKAYAK